MHEAHRPLPSDRTETSVSRLHHPARPPKHQDPSRNLRRAWEGQSLWPSVRRASLSCSGAGLRAIYSFKSDGRSGFVDLVCSRRRPRCPFGQRVLWARAVGSVCLEHVCRVSLALRASIWVQALRDWPGARVGRQRALGWGQWAVARGVGIARSVGRQSREAVDCVRL